MILTCPNCSAIFTLESDLLGNTGKKVKCSSCNEIWFQEPESKDEPVADSNEDVESNNNPQDEPAETDEALKTHDITEVNFDTPNNDPPPTQNKTAITKDTKDSTSLTKGKLISIAISVSLFFVILLYLLLNSANITAKHPNMYAFYDLIGVDLEVAGQGLVFDQVNASNNGKAITISGNIINIESKENKVPMIEASILDGSENIVSKWYIEIPKDIIEAEETISFNSSFDIDTSSDQQISTQVRFVLFNKNKENPTKTDEEDGGSNPERHQDENDHQSAPEESSKSHQPSSSDPHQESSPHQDH